MISEVINQFKKDMPVAFPGTHLEKLTGGNYRWRTLQNEKCKGLAPEEMFIRQGRKLLVVRDKFLPYWESKLSQPEAA